MLPSTRSNSDRLVGQNVAVPTLVEFHGWRFAADPARTADAYAASDRQGARGCKCNKCRNLVAQRDREYPLDLMEFLRRVGVDPFKEAEVWAVIEERLHTNAGWWHFVGEVVAKGDPAIDLEPNVGATGREWQVIFLPGKRDLSLKEFGDAPLVQVEFTARLPWVLDEPCRE